MRLFVDARKLRHGGIGRYIENLLIGLFRQNIELTLVCSSNEDTQSLRKLSDTKITTYLVDTAPQYSIREYFFFALKYKKFIDSCDWYISPHYTLPFFISCKKLVVIHDCIHVTYPDTIFHKLIGKILIRSAINRANKVLTVSEASKSSIVNEFGVKDSGIHVIHNSLLSILSGELPMHRSDYISKPKLLFIGADRPHKRIGIFLEFLNLLRDSNFEFQATLVTELKEDSEMFIKLNHLSSCTNVYSKISNQELLGVYKNSDFLVSTSAEEGFCLPLLEGMSMGLSVIAPLRPFSEELLSDAGWFFESGSAADLFRVFVNALSDLELMKRKIQTGMRRAEEYSLASNTELFLEYLKAA